MTQTKEKQCKRIHKGNCSSLSSPIPCMLTSPEFVLWLLITTLVTENHMKELFHDDGIKEEEEAEEYRTSTSTESVKKNEEERRRIRGKEQTKGITIFQCLIDN